MTQRACTQINESQTRARARTHIFQCASAHFAPNSERPTCARVCVCHSLLSRQAPAGSLIEGKSAANDDEVRQTDSFFGGNTHTT